MSEPADDPGPEQAVEALTRGVEILRSMSLHEEAGKVAAVVEPLGMSRAIILVSLQPSGMRS